MKDDMKKQRKDIVDNYRIVNEQLGSMQQKLTDQIHEFSLKMGEFDSHNRKIQRQMDI